MKPEPAQVSSPKGEVLVVDDTAASLSFLCELLSAEGYSVRAAPGGELALWTAASRPPDLVLLDVRMPGIDGFEVCRRLKSNPQTAAVPVIFLSAQTDVEDKIRGFQVGGVDYIGKPFSSDEVLQRVATHVQLALVTRELAREKLSLEERVQKRTEQLELTANSLRQEVVARTAAEAKLRLAASAFEASLSAAFITDAEGTIVATNPAFTALMGYTSEECLGKNPRLLKSGKHDQAYYQAMWLAIQSEGKWTGEIWNRRKDGNVFPCLHTITAVRDDNGFVINYVGVLLDLSESRDAQTLIEFLTRHDPLTGLPNRVLVRDRFSQLLSSAQESAETLAVICINLDKFRFVNDFHGHAIGDAVLQWVSGELSECLPSKDTIFREGGDEFVLVHRDQSGLLGIRLLVETIQSRLKGEVVIEGTRLDISASLGIAIYPSDGGSLDELVGNAAIAMSRAKEHGGETHAFFTEKLDQGVRFRFDIAQRLRHALGLGEFEVYYQPQINAASGRIVAAEALLRWRNPDLGFVSPAQFIPVAEETGRIVEIGAWVLQTVCAQIACWHRQGHGLVKVAVNLSAMQFMREDLCQTVAAALAGSGIPPACLELEITESAIIDNVQRAIDIMHGFKKIGVTVSLDDFGTGYSSLSYLKKFPIDYLKIDQSFVRDLLAEPDADAIVLSIIGLAHNMRMRVVAEGVETQAQCDFLSANGCDLLQGYLFSTPLPAAEFLGKWLDLRG